MVIYISRCTERWQAKAEHQHPLGLLQPLALQDWKEEEVTMAFINDLPKTGTMHDTIMVVIYKVTKHAHFFCSVYT